MPHHNKGCQNNTEAFLNQRHSSGVETNVDMRRVHLGSSEVYLGR
jgi:hypothetical protein